MSKGFPLSWETWEGGTRAAYALVEEVEQKRAGGEQVTEEEEALYPGAKKITERYRPDGHKRNKWQK